MTDTGELVASKTICLVLSMGRFGNSKQAPMTNVVVAADKKLLRITKMLLDSPELQAILSHDAQLSTRIRALAFKSLFKSGVYLLPVAIIPTVEEILTEAMATRATLVDAAVEMLPVRAVETSKRLGVMHTPGDYPTAERFRASFYVRHFYVTFETPAKLEQVSAELFVQERQKAAARLESVAAECRYAMRAGLAELVAHLADRLTPDVDGKPKRLYHTTVQHLHDFLQLFELRNVTDDADLAAVAERCRQVMSGITHEVLEDNDVRLMVAEELKKVKAAIDPLVVAMGTRTITLDEEALV